ncbi:hypothetical protein DFH06DRAFT_653594 [Mycena polygramma]|nr:hypothetical protein DFH06DRAFT_653594 [Mycena polygramma]
MSAGQVLAILAPIHRVLGAFQQNFRVTKSEEERQNHQPPSKFSCRPVSGYIRLIKLLVSSTRFADRHGRSTFKGLEAERGGQNYIFWVLVYKPFVNSPVFNTGL